LAITLLPAINTPVFAAEPTQPGSLHTSVYSATAAEFFWERSSADSALIGYEICMPGVVCTTVDALSYFTNFLKPGTNYTFSVLAIDVDGARSPVSRVSFVAGDRNTVNLAGPEAPENLAGVVYSKTAAEIMWDRAATQEIRYEVFRNAVLVKVTDGVSYFDDNLAPAGIYDYSVRAVDDKGNRSASASVTLTTSGDSSVPSTTEPSAPFGLLARVYSSTAAEVTWSRPPTVGLQYDILRNGLSVKITDGISYFDDFLLAGSTYTPVLHKIPA